MTADDTIPAADQVVERELKRQRVGGDDAYANDGENAEARSGAVAPIEAPPPMEFNAEGAGDESYGGESYGVAEVDSSAWGADGTAEDYDQYADADGDESEGGALDDAQDDGETDDDAEEDEDEEDENDDDDDANDDEEEDADDDDDDDEEEEENVGVYEGGEGEAEIKPDSVGWYDLTPAQRQAAQELQYTREAWDNCTRTEVTDQEYWHQLTDEQQKAAQVTSWSRVQPPRHSRTPPQATRALLHRGWCPPTHTQSGSTCGQLRF